jgi:hypothetical protein
MDAAIVAVASQRLFVWRRPFAAVMVLIAALIASHFAQAAEGTQVLRWTTRDGHNFRARFLRVQGESVVFARDRLEFTVPIFTLSTGSLKWVTRQAGQPLKAIPVAPLAAVGSFTLGPSILAFGQNSLGQKIGNGECGALAAAALRLSGAAPRGGPDSPNPGDYVWGQEVAWVQSGFFGLKGTKELAQVEPGDIVQFHNTRFSGFTHGEEGVYSLETPHHTAIIESVDPARKTISVLHQNWNGQQVVHRQTLFLRGMTRGWLRFYHPISASL